MPKPLWLPRAQPSRNALSQSVRFGASARPGAAGKVGDTGPWFIGKMVAEIRQIRGVLGRSGMGIVYRGYDTATHREIAVKVPQDDFRDGKLVRRFVDDQVARGFFTREARARTELIHPHIVRAFDARDDQTTGYCLAKG